MRRVTALAVIVVVLAAPYPAGLSAAAAGAEPLAARAARLPYVPPVDGVLVDTFRPPATAYGAGNLGIDYATTAGQPVWAAGAGKVVFAGPVGGRLHVVVLHDDGLRTSYSFLASVRVSRGDEVDQGEPVGTTAGGVHFGARAGEAYLDPLVLFGQRPGRTYLVPDDDRRPLSAAEERRGLLDGLKSFVGRAGDVVGDVVVDGVTWLEGQVRANVQAKIDLIQVLVSDAIALGVPLPLYLAVVAVGWEDEQAGCTPPDVAPPPPSGRRIALLVGGLASSTGDARVLEVDHLRLGYAPDDVHQFSYRADGGPYVANDTLSDIVVAGDRLVAQVRRLAADNPGVPIDVIAHSQGGLVARSGLTAPGAPAVATVVTLGTPHEGTDLATAAVGIAGTTSGTMVLELVDLAHPAGVEPGSTAVAQMAEVSGFIRDLRDSTWPPSTKVVSVAARDDPVVPNFHSRLPGGANVVVTLDEVTPLSDHERLPGSEQATREIARALGGQGPTCRSLVDRLADELQARQYSRAQDTAGAALAVAALYLDVRAKAAVKRR